MKNDGPRSAGFGAAAVAHNKMTLAIGDALKDNPELLLNSPSYKNNPEKAMAFFSRSVRGEMADKLQSDLQQKYGGNAPKELQGLLSNLLKSAGPAAGLKNRLAAQDQAAAITSTKDAISSVWNKDLMGEASELVTSIGDSSPDEIANNLGLTGLEYADQVFERTNEYAKEQGKSLPMTDNSPWGKVKAAIANIKAAPKPEIKPSYRPDHGDDPRINPNDTLE